MQWWPAAMADLLAAGVFVGIAAGYAAAFCLIVYLTYCFILQAIDMAALIAFVRTAEKQGAKVWRWPGWAIRYSRWRHRP